MPMKLNPTTCELDMVMGPGSGTATIEITTDVASPVNPTGAGIVAITGTSVYSDGTVANTVTLNVQSTAETFLVGSGSDTNSTELGPLADGELIIGALAGAPAAGTLTAGAGIGIVNAANSVTISATGAGFSWTVVTDATQALVEENGYIGNRGTAITYTLPAAVTVGEVIRITNIGAGLPVIAQNAGDYINFTASTTTVGVDGSLTAVDQFSSITLVCVVANDGWNVLSSTGNWTVV